MKSFNEICCLHNLSKCDCEASGEPIPELKHYTQHVFRDQVRRIDVVLVALNHNKKNAEAARSYFLQSVLKAGLQVEIEPGIHEKHRKLLFIKIHAPDKVLMEFNDIFGTKKYFRDTHIRYIRSEMEQEWIKLVRKQYIKPLMLSGAERSLIVYRILLQLPFGEYENFVGINRLIDRYVFADIYALHDGPYFFARNDDLSRISARQILYYNWPRMIHLFKKQPLSLIREYFGEKIAFYFAFYEFFNDATAIAATVAACFIFLQIWITVDDPISYFHALKAGAPLLRTLRTDMLHTPPTWVLVSVRSFRAQHARALLWKYLTTFSYKAFMYSQVQKRDICNNSNNTYICPKCYAFEVCPFQKLTSFCFSAYLDRVLDSPITILYAWFIVLWAFYFVVMWRRKEKYLIWLWEVNTNKFKRTFRPESSITSKTREKCMQTGLIHHYDVRIKTYLVHILVTFIFITLDFYFHMRISLTLMYFIEQKYPLLSMYVLKQVPVFNENFIARPLRYITKLGNHETYIAYYRSFSLKYFLVTFLGTFAMLFIFAWANGRSYVVPIKTGTDMYNRAYSVYLYAHCGPFTTCINDVAMLLMGIIFSRYGLVRVWQFVVTWSTDYNPEEHCSEIIPSWEREYRLDSISEEQLIEKYNNIALQFAMIILVGAIFPFAPIIILITNVLHIRCAARKILLCSRRPLLLEEVGTGIWTDVANVLAYGCTVSNALTIGLTTKNDLRNIYLSKFKSMEGFLFYTMTPMDTEIYNDEKRYPYFKKALDNYRYNIGRYVPKVCYTPGLWTPPHEKNEHYYFIDFPYLSKVFEVAYNAEYYEYKTTRALNMVFFNIASLFCLNVIQRAMPPFSKTLTNIIRIEKELEKRYLKEQSASEQKAEEKRRKKKRLQTTGTE